MLEEQIRIFQEQLKESSDSIERKNQEAEAQIEALTDTIEAQNAVAEEQFEALAKSVDESINDPSNNGVTVDGYATVRFYVVSRAVTSFYHSTFLGRSINNF